ncbi:hypothetical protein KKA93_02645 [Patescibacteria group bacterium]|nr:hypothetical protein [Patescibacteria group bacterium]MBU1663204.1 hypothetical protein [Patescibacteria group bacterium]MBU1933762.1 hypothetical protein [Patescibacteria group bacterium]MBU2007502.1 hypothetical protein [Patescibacteria group bacterium]MBU2233767.1 hypothetical protein [Patescibacteria group bacterium]
MARRKTENENIRKLTKIGDRNIGLTLPVEMIRKLKWKERQKVACQNERKEYNNKRLEIRIKRICRQIAPHPRESRALPAEKIILPR